MIPKSCRTCARIVRGESLSHLKFTGSYGGHDGVTNARARHHHYYLGGTCLNQAQGSGFKGEERFRERAGLHKTGHRVHRLTKLIQIGERERERGGGGGREREREREFKSFCPRLSCDKKRIESVRKRAQFAVVPIFLLKGTAIFRQNKMQMELFAIIMNNFYYSAPVNTPAVMPFASYRQSNVILKAD